MKKGNPDIGKHAAKGGNKLLELYGKDYFKKLGKSGRRKQLKALKNKA